MKKELIKKIDSKYILESGKYKYELQTSLGKELNLNKIENTMFDFEWEFTQCKMFEWQGQGFSLEKSKIYKIHNGGKELQINMVNKSRDIKISLHYSCFPENQVIKYHTEIENIGTSTLKRISGFIPFSINIKENGKSYNIYEFWEKKTKLSFSENKVDSDNWIALENSSNNEIIIFVVDKDGNIFDWQFQISKQNGNIYLIGDDMRSLNVSLEPGDTIIYPDIFLGVNRGNLDSACNEMRYFLKSFVLLKPPEKFPWLIYNLWFTDSNAENLFYEELELAYDMGFDCVVYDAAWYKGSSLIPGMNDWAAGLGNYTVNRKIFPQGLEPLAQNVHDKGLKFGIWVDPHMVDYNLVKSGEIPEKWIARKDGQDLVCKDPSLSPMAQLCLGNPDVVKWLKDNLSGLIQKLNVDWIKWDPSGTQNYACNREDHGHKKCNGSYAFWKGLMDIWSYLMKEFPDLVGWECVSSFKYSKVNLGSSYLLPEYSVKFGTGPMLAPYVLGSLECINSNHHSFNYDPNIYYTASYLDYYFRKQFINLRLIFGNINGMTSQRLSLAPPGFLEAYKRNIIHFKKYRDYLKEDIYHLKSDKDWTTTEFCKKNGSSALVFVFRKGGNQTNTIKLQGLNESSVYKLTSFNKRPQRGKIIKGRDLLNEGLSIELPDPWLSGNKFNLKKMSDQQQKAFKEQVKYGSDIILIKEL